MTSDREIPPPAEVNSARSRSIPDLLLGIPPSAVTFSRGRSPTRCYIHATGTLRPCLPKEFAPSSRKNDYYSYSTLFIGCSSWGVYHGKGNCFNLVNFKERTAKGFRDEPSEKAPGGSSRSTCGWVNSTFGGDDPTPAAMAMPHPHRRRGVQAAVMTGPAIAPSLELSLPSIPAIAPAAGPLWRIPE